MNTEEKIQVLAYLVNKLINSEDLTHYESAMLAQMAYNGKLLIEKEHNKSDAAIRYYNLQQEIIKLEEQYPELAKSGIIL